MMSISLMFIAKILNEKMIGYNHVREDLFSISFEIFNMGKWQCKAAFSLFTSKKKCIDTTVSHY